MINDSDILTIALQELVRSVVQGTKVTMRVGDGTSYATGYLVDFDEHDYLLGATYDGEDAADPPLLLMISRRVTSVVQYYQLPTYESEEPAVREFLDEYRQRFLLRHGDVVKALAA